MGSSSPTGASQSSHVVSSSPTGPSESNVHASPEHSPPSEPGSAGGHTGTRPPLGARGALPSAHVGSEPSAHTASPAVSDGVLPPWQLAGDALGALARRPPAGLRDRERRPRPAGTVRCACARCERVFVQACKLCLVRAPPVLGQLARCVRANAPPGVSASASAHSSASTSRQARRRRAALPWVTGRRIVRERHRPGVSSCRVPAGVRGRTAGRGASRPGDAAAGRAGMSACSSGSGARGPRMPDLFAPAAAKPACAAAGR